MYCAICASGNQAIFTTEMNIHFHGLENMDSPGVLVFPKVSVCLDCGSSRFTTPKTELSQLARCAPTGASTGERSDDVVVHRSIMLGA
jgi:hypothetical protein